MNFLSDGAMAVPKSLPAHNKRDDESLCPTAKYVSPNSLIFHTQCNQSLADRSDSVLIVTDEDSASFEDCMGECGIYRPKCYAVAYRNNQCSLFAVSLESVLSPGGKNPYNVAIADAAQLNANANTGCPFEDGATYTTENGLEFTIDCNTDYGPDGGDFCADNYSYEDWECPPHADTMQECLDICSKAHPLCKGVTWNPNMDSGFGNCYLKNNPEGSTDPGHGPTAQSAKVTSSLYKVDTSCENESSYTTSQSDDKYSVSCYQDRVGSQNITTIHAYSLNDCLNDCSDMDDCKGVVFDMSLSYGYENCYLQNATGRANPGANATFALRTSFDNSGSGSGSKAWIAGPVIGIVALLAVLITFALYWRKRRARKLASKQDFNHQREVYEKPGKPRPFEVGPGAHGPYDRRYELQDPNSEALYLHEMARSPK